MATKNTLGIIKIQKRFSSFNFDVFDEPVNAPKSKYLVSNKDSIGSRDSKEITGAIPNNNNNNKISIVLDNNNKNNPEPKKVERTSIFNNLPENNSKKSSIFNGVSSNNILGKIINNVLNFKLFSKIISKKKYKWYIINPNSKIEYVYQIIIAVVIFYSVTVIPFTMSIYVIDDLGLSHPLNIFELITEIIFVVDFIKNFITGFYNDEKKLIMQPKAIIKNYFFGWFFIDLISSIPIKIITILTESDVNNLKILKLTKLPRIMKFLKLAKILKLFKYIKEKDKLDGLLKKITKIKPGYERMVGSFLFSIIIFHCIACFWFYAVIINPEKNWFNVRYDNSFYDSGSKYLISLYWTIQTVFTVGYGDFFITNIFESVISIIIMFFGVFIYTFVIGNINSIFTMMSLNDLEFQQNVDILTEIVKE